VSYEIGARVGSGGTVASGPEAASSGSEASGCAGAGGAAGSRRRISSGGPWEARYGYSRAIVAGDSCHVSGTTDAGPDGRSLHPGDAAAQARAALGIIERALVEAGLTRVDVVRTRMYLTNLADATAVGEVHGEWFRDVRPASTLVVVAALIDPTILVEIEADARRD
jgi:enamine deaminase RidA (YjgF/YER057c/UK114 family)